jgi:hypothetical protein
MRSCSMSIRSMESRITNSFSSRVGTATSYGSKHMMKKQVPIHEQTHFTPPNMTNFNNGMENSNVTVPLHQTVIYSPQRERTRKFSESSDILFLASPGETFHIRNNPEKREHARKNSFPHFLKQENKEIH